MNRFYQPQIRTKKQLKTIEYVTNKTIKTFDYVYSFPSNTYNHQTSGEVLTKKQLDGRYPTKIY